MTLISVYHLFPTLGPSNKSPLKYYKGNQPWLLIGRTDAEAGTPIFWPPDVKSWVTGKDSDAGKDWRHEEKGMMEDETVGWHHWLNGHEFEQAPGDGEAQGSWVCCSSWGCKEPNTTVWLNNNSKVSQHSDKKSLFPLFCSFDKSLGSLEKVFMQNGFRQEVWMSFLLSVFLLESNLRWSPWRYHHYCHSRHLRAKKWWSSYRKY